MGCIDICCFGYRKSPYLRKFASLKNSKLPVIFVFADGCRNGPAGFAYFERSLHLLTWLMRRKMLGVGWGGGVMLTFLALVNMVDATQYVGCGVGGWGDVNVPCTC